jgi:benzoyl-CoA reductase subunit C
MALGISGAGDWLEVIRGDAYYQSYLCHIPRSTIEMAVSGRLDFVDGMLFPSTCDVIRNLSGMWQLLRKDAYVRYLDVPQNFDDATGGAFWEHELRTLGAELGALTGRAPSDDDLRRSVHVYAENRRAVDALYALRRERPEAVTTAEAYLLVRAGNVLPVEEHTQLLREHFVAASSVKRPTTDQTRVVVVGAFCEQPPLGLLRTIERAGCAVVDDDMILVSRWFTEPVRETGDPWKALAEAFVRHSVPTATVYSPRRGRGKALVDRVRAAGADGVVFAAPSFCTPALLDQPMLAAALDEASIPWTAFRYAENAGQFHSIREQTGTFADSVRLWSAA